jgi:hypothetical protein
MGGCGSGRRGSFSTKPTCEGMLAIDLAYLRRHDLLRPEKVSTLSWSQRGHPSGSIRIIAQAEGLGLSYRTTGQDGAPRDVLELVPFLYTATKFGGRRVWFQCLACRRRCRVPYGGARFRCRQCYGLAYASQRESAFQRALDQADKIAKRLGSPFGCAFDGSGLPPKPKRMRWRTYQRLEKRYEALQRQGLASAYAKFGGFLR